MHTRTKRILDFWFKETPPKKKFQKHKDFDALIKKNFLKDYELAGSNEYDDWQDSPCLLYTSPSPRDGLLSRMPSSA